MSEQQNTQQPVAYLYTRSADGETFVHKSIMNWEGHSRQPVFAAPPVPRDVLMAFGEAVRTACFNACDESGGDMGAVACVNVADLADRYASQAQPEPACQTCGGTGVVGDYLTLAYDCPDCARCDSDPELVSYAPDMATCTLRIGAEQYLFDRHVDQPELVNKQLLAALKDVTLSEDEAELGTLVAPTSYAKARQLIAKSEAVIVEELKRIEEICPHKNPELFVLIQEYGAAEHNQNDGLAVHLLSKIKTAIDAAEAAQPEPVGEAVTDALRAAESYISEIGTESDDVTPTRRAKSVLEKIATAKGVIK